MIVAGSLVVLTALFAGAVIGFFAGHRSAEKAERSKQRLRGATNEELLQELGSRQLEE